MSASEPNPATMVSHTFNLYQRDLKCFIDQSMIARKSPFSDFYDVRAQMFYGDDDFYRLTGIRGGNTPFGLISFLMDAVSLFKSYNKTFEDVIKEFGAYENAGHSLARWATDSRAETSHYSRFVKS